MKKAPAGAFLLVECRSGVQHIPPITQRLLGKNGVKRSSHTLLSVEYCKQRPSASRVSSQKRRGERPAVALAVTIKAIPGAAPNSRCRSVATFTTTKSGGASHFDSCPCPPSLLPQQMQLASTIRRIKILIRPAKYRSFVRNITSCRTFKPHINPDPDNDLFVDMTHHQPVGEPDTETFICF